MFRSQFITAIRNMRRYTLCSAISTIGLAVGLGVSIVILLFAWNTLTIDSFHENSGHTYLIYKAWQIPVGEQIVPDTWIPELSALKEEDSGIIDGVRMFDTQNAMNVHFFCAAVQNPADSLRYE